MNKLLQLIGVSIALGLINNILFFDQDLGLNFPIFIACVLAAGWLLTRKQGEKISRTNATLSMCALFFAIMVCVRSSVLLTVFNVVGCALLLLILAQTFLGKKIKEYVPNDYLYIFLVPFAAVSGFFRTMTEFFEFRKISNPNSKTPEVIRGVVYAILALIIFTFLFSSADAVFGDVMKNIFSFNLDMTLVGRTVFFIIVSAFFIGVFGYMTRRSVYGHTDDVQNVRTVGAIETRILLISITSLFFLFIAFQITYLFGGQSHILAQGLNYAEYARQGFFELIIVALLSYIIISVLEKRIVKKEQGHIFSFKVLTTVLIAEVIIILISAFVRLMAYEQAYGFTTIRLYSHALMIWMSLIFILLAHHIITHSQRKRFALQSFRLVVLLLFVMNMLNPDVFIAKRNLERYQETGKIDTYYLANLSHDAVPYTLTLLKDAHEETRTEFANYLYYSTVMSEINNPNWKSSNIAKSESKFLIAPYREFIEAQKDLAPQNKLIPQLEI